jgi:hypothetical protein
VGKGALSRAVPTRLAGVRGKDDSCLRCRDIAEHTSLAASFSLLLYSLIDRVTFSFDMLIGSGAFTGLYESAIPSKRSQFAFYPITFMPSGHCRRAILIFRCAGV